MTNVIDAAYERMVALQAELAKPLSQPINEAATRFHVLDRILIEGLHWPNDQIEPEAAVTDGFVDYTLNNLSGRPVMVIEAKRVGRLDLSSATQSVSEVALSGKLLRPLKSAIGQAIYYASMQSVSLACVTDGQVWLFFQTNRRDGLNVMEGKGILFPSITSVMAKFARFHDLLSPSGLREGLGLVQLNRADGIRAAFEEEQRIVSPPDEAKMLPRNELARDASLLFQQFFAGINSESDPEMMRACFVETAESNKADLELQKIAQKLLNGIETLDTGSSQALQDHLERAMSVMTSESVLLVGNKGSGKSTFLSRFFKDVLPAHLQKQCYVIRVPLEEIPDTDRDRAPAWALNQLRDQVELVMFGRRTPTFDELRGVFFGEYQRLREGTLAPLYKKDPDDFRHQFGLRLEKMRAEEPSEYVKAFLRRAVTNDKRLPIIVFDNADQFPPATQDALYQLAHSFSVASPVLNIMPITDRTVWRLSKTGALQSYPARSFYLPVPEAKKILQKRIDYVNSKLNDSPDMAKSYFSSRGFRVKLDNIDRFSQAVERIFVSNDFVSGLIGRLANFDIRRMLQVAERIFLSPETRIDEVLKGSFGFQPGRSEILRIHRALIKGEYDRYSYRENEFVYNVFWTDPAWPASPALAFYILWTLKARMAKARVDSVDSRHWTSNEICQFFEPMGSHPDQTIVVLRRLVDRGLVEPLDPSIEVIGNGVRLAITDSGVAHIELVRSSDVYLEQMALATGLNSLGVFNQLRDHRTAGTATSFKAIKKRFAEYIIEIDLQRSKIPSAKEYAGILEARAALRLLSSPEIRDIGLEQRTIPQRDAPAPSIGSAFRRW